MPHFLHQGKKKQQQKNTIWDTKDANVLHNEFGLFLQRNFYNGL